ncbi:MAG: hypothetical protein K8L97_25175 [Anaerolineae bacterium]|nr:hypothetical protein [Anaerolineae bacterium]
MNLSPEVIEQALWLVLYGAAIGFAALLALLTGFSVMELIHGRKDENVIPEGGFNLNVEIEKGKLVVQGKDVRDE